jgi:hypothetical protein
MEFELRSKLMSCSRGELQEYCKERAIKKYYHATKEQLIENIIKYNNFKHATTTTSGGTTTAESKVTENPSKNT